MSKAEKTKNFDPNNPGDISGNIFGLPFNMEEAEIAILPVPWDVTVSYGHGTAKGPKAVLDASYQVDLYFPGINDAWKLGIALDEIRQDWKKQNKSLRKKAESHIEFLEKGGDLHDEPTLQRIVDEVNKGCEALKSEVKNRAVELLEQGKIVATLGGDHSTPLGLMEALSEKYEQFGILQVDAHMDLRKAYENFTYSHASIMYNALQLQNISQLVQVGIRDYCDEEMDFARENNEKIKTWFERDARQQIYEGNNWANICDQIVAQLPEHVYISFDIDGLDPKLCPNTGTPVPGGLEFEEATYLIKKVVDAGKKIIGFDLSEVNPGKTEWDGNVGARMLYALCNYTGLSNGKFDQ